MKQGITLNTCKTNKTNLVIYERHNICSSSGLYILILIKDKLISLQLQLLSLELAIRAFVLHKKTMCSEELSFFSCCPQRYLD